MRVPRRACWELKQAATNSLLQRIIVQLSTVKALPQAPVVVLRLVPAGHLVTHAQLKTSLEAM